MSDPWVVGAKRRSSDHCRAPGRPACLWQQARPGHSTAAPRAVLAGAGPSAGGGEGAWAAASGQPAASGGYRGPAGRRGVWQWGRKRLGSELPLAARGSWRCHPGAGCRAGCPWPLASTPSGRGSGAGPRRRGLAQWRSRRKAREPARDRRSVVQTGRERSRPASPPLFGPAPSLLPARQTGPLNLPAPPLASLSDRRLSLSDRLPPVARARALTHAPQPPTA